MDNNEQYEMNNTNNSRTFLKRSTYGSNTGSFHKNGSQEREMRSTR